MLYGSNFQRITLDKAYFIVFDQVPMINKAPHH